MNTFLLGTGLRRRICAPHIHFVHRQFLLVSSVFGTFSVRLHSRTIYYRNGYDTIKTVLQFCDLTVPQPQNCSTVLMVANTQNLLSYGYIHINVSDSKQNQMSFENKKKNKPPRYMLDPFDHPLPGPFHPQMDQNDFLSLWTFYSTVLHTTSTLLS